MLLNMILCCKQYREQPFQQIKQQGESRKPFASSPQNVRCANIAGPNGPYVTAPRETREQQTKGDGTKRIAQQQSHNHVEPSITHYTNPLSFCIV